MNTEQQRRYRVQLARTRRRQRRIRNVLRFCLTTVAVGLIMVAAIWYDRADGQAAGGTGAGAGTGGQLMTQEQSVQEYPESLLKLLELNPEAEPFVRGYFQNRDKHPEIDLSGEVVQGTIPLFLQWDERWGYETYGSDLIAITGCGPTCLSMVLYYLTGDESLTPDVIGDYSMDNGYYLPGTGTLWALMEDVAPIYGVGVKQPEASEWQMKSALDRGAVLICSMKPGDFTAGGHFIVIYGYDQNGFLVNDPNCVARSRQSWSYEQISRQMKHLWVFE